MKLNNKFLFVFGGWSGSVILVIALLLPEIGSYIIGGDWGSFLFVTFHFILIPLFSIFVLCITIIKVYKMQKHLSRIVAFLSVIIPLSILYIVITGSTVLMEFLNINFNRP